MKIKFAFLITLLLFARGCDFYSTSLWFFDDPSGETNPLTRFLGFGWTGLIITNLVLVGLIIYGYYYYSFKYTRPKPPARPERLTDYISTLYFNEKGKLHRLLYKMPENRNIAIGHTGYVVIRVVIVGSFLATIHNLCQFYNVTAYDTYREIVRRPLFVIYGLIVVSILYFSYRLWKKEYDLARKNFIVNEVNLTPNDKTP